MNTFRKLMMSGTVPADGAVGSLLFERTGRLSEQNHLYEALNLQNPDLIRGVHLAYLKAGARCLTTNTFAANPTMLDPVGEGGSLQAINEAAVRIAREAIAEHCARTGEAGPYSVMGSMGPTRGGEESREEAAEIYTPQITALRDAGADALQLETFANLEHVAAILERRNALAPEMPVVVAMSAQRRGDHGGWMPDPAAFVEMAEAGGADAIGVNCCAPWDAEAYIDLLLSFEPIRQGRIHLIAMPNAGGFYRIGNRYLTRVNPEYMGRFARTLASKGVRLIGGCCEVHPPHIREMANYLRSISAGAAASPTPSIPATGPGEGGARVDAGDKAPAGKAEKRDNGVFSRKLCDGEFVVSVELLPARGTTETVLEKKVRFVEELAGSGLADALDLTDGSRGIPLIPPVDFATVVRERLGWTPATGDPIEFIPHFTTRDLSVMGIQSRLVGYWAQRIHNVLFITGDPPKMSPTYPRSTAVFDVDSADLIDFTHHRLNAGLDFGAQPLGRQDDPRTHFTIGTGFEPEAVDLEREMRRLEAKVGNGADYIMTQPAFRTEPLAALEPYRGRVAILVGVLVLTSLEQAKRVAQVPGVVLPDAVLDRLARFDDRKDQAQAGRDIAVEQAQWIIREGWSGLYLMSPSTHTPILDVLRGARA